MTVTQAGRTQVPSPWAAGRPRGRGRGRVSPAAAGGTGRARRDGNHELPTPKSKGTGIQKELPFNKTFHHTLLHRLTCNFCQSMSTCIFFQTSLHWVDVINTSTVYVGKNTFFEKIEAPCMTCGSPSHTVATSTMPTWKESQAPKTCGRVRPHVGVCHSLVDQRGLLQGRQGDVKIRWITFSTSYSASRYLPRCINLALQSFENHSQKPHSLQRCA